jgi:oxygen-independent coproporphyrinogen-3 oxidase
MPFAADGFVRINGNRIIVEEGGRPYLRLIASKFDAYLPNSQVRHSVAV